jgi:hypothetical protein
MCERPGRRNGGHDGAPGRLSCVDVCNDPVANLAVDRRIGRRNHGARAGLMADGTELLDADPDRAARINPD